METIEEQKTMLNFTVYPSVKNAFRTIVNKEKEKNRKITTNDVFEKMLLSYKEKQAQAS